MQAPTETTKIIENVKVVERQKTPEDIAFLTEKFSESRIFTQLNEGQM